MRSLLFAFFICSFFASTAGIFDRINEAIEKGEFDKAEKLIVKFLEKEPENPGGLYYMSVLFLEPSCELFQIDSAKSYIDLALTSWQQINTDFKAELLDDGISLEKIVTHSNRVTDAAFRRAVEINSLISIVYFLEKYPESNYQIKAIGIRDSLAFVEIGKSKKWQDFKKYMNQYPSSKYVSEAKKQYDRLLFNEYVADETLESYVSFLDKYPQTPYRKQAEREIFQKSTSDGLWDGFYWFVNNYPNTDFSQKSMDILYGFVLNGQSDSMDEILEHHPKKDSLRRLEVLRPQKMMPVLKSGKIGFYDFKGGEIITPSFEDCDADYKCGSEIDQWILVNQNGIWSVINRKGDLLLTGVKKISPAGKYLWIAEQSASYLYHMSGFKITDLPIDQAKPLSNGWIAVRHNFKWGIITVQGKQVTDFEYESISEAGEFLILEKAEGFQVSTLSAVQNRKSDLDMLFDDFEVFDGNKLQGFSGSVECLIHTNLEYLLQPDTMEIIRTGNQWFAKTETGYIVYDNADFKAMPYDDIQINASWLASLQQGKWSVKSMISDSVYFDDIDSVRLLNEYAVLIEKGDSSFVVFQNNYRLKLEDEHLESISSFDGQNAFIVASDFQKSRVLDMNGSLLFQQSPCAIKFLRDSLFIIKRNDKMGLSNAKGEMILPLSYEVIDDDGSLIYMLKSGKIGALDYYRNVTIPATFASRVQKFGKNYAIVENGLYGVIDSLGSEVLPPMYSQIMAWTDTSSWVKGPQYWQLIGHDKNVILDHVISIENLDKNMIDDTWIIASGKSGLGLFSSKMGEILPMNYQEIRNIGYSTYPVILADQYLPIARFHVVSYLDGWGNIIFSEAYRPDEYELIYCNE